MHNGSDTSTALTEAQALLDAAWKTEHSERFEQLIKWATSIIEPLAQAGIAEALWLQSSLPTDGDISAELFEQRYQEQLEKAAQAGHAEAQFRLACELDTPPTQEQSAALFKTAAESGHAHAMWCHGLNLLANKQDDTLALSFIKQSAHLKFEGAIKFMADACANGTHQQEKDEAESAKWWKQLASPDLIHY